MTIWLLKRLTKHPVYDCNDGFVVVADSEGEARRLADGYSGDEHDRDENYVMLPFWTNRAKASCIEIGLEYPQHEPGDRQRVVLRDFHAG